METKSGIYLEFLTEIIVAAVNFVNIFSTFRNFVNTVEVISCANGDFSVLKTQMTNSIISAFPFSALFICINVVLLMITRFQLLLLYIVTLKNVTLRENYITLHSKIEKHYT